MRILHLLVPALFSLLILPSVGGEIVFSGVHWVPQVVTEGEETTIFVVVVASGQERIEEINIIYLNTTNRMTTDDPELNFSTGVLYTHVFSVKDQEVLIFNFNAVDANGMEWTSEEFNITVEPQDRNEGVTLFGLPRLYCSISIIFITLIVIFLTWSYFKGRRMQKDSERKTGVVMMSCSECGAPVGPDQERCARCGADLDEEEHLCGKCGGKVSDRDAKCPHCGSRLRPVNKDELKDKKGDPDLEKLNKRVDLEGKVECPVCGAVYLENEKKCPQCGK
ncbi:MAG: zinc ribbon domain-containing protein [Thermoplasmatota archaeon]